MDRIVTYKERHTVILLCMKAALVIGSFKVMVRFQKTRGVIRVSPTVSQRPSRRQKYTAESFYDHLP